MNVTVVTDHHVLTARDAMLLRALARFRRNRGALVGLVIVTLIIVFSTVGPLLTGHSPFAVTP